MVQLTVELGLSVNSLLKIVKSMTSQYLEWVIGKKLNMAKSIQGKSEVF